MKTEKSTIKKKVGWSKEQSEAARRRDEGLRSITEEIEATTYTDQPDDGENTAVGGQTIEKSHDDKVALAQYIDCNVQEQSGAAQ